VATLYLSAGQSATWWFGVAWEGDGIVACAIGDDRQQALRHARRCLPAGAHAVQAEGPSAFLDETVAMLGELERGDETNKRVALSEAYRSEAARRILLAAAHIPLGFVTTYGELARAVGSEARAVGRAMATNPVYPIVPCHRVVGADMSLVGYGGRQSEEALAAKLDRLTAEARGATDSKEVAFPGGSLPVHPVEKVLVASRADSLRRQRQAAAEAGRQEADDLQGRLF